MTLLVPPLRVRDPEPRISMLEGSIGTASISSATKRNIEKAVGVSPVQDFAGPKGGDRIIGGSDGTRTRGLLRDRQAF
jgi:hypothetical protein